jgi:hypothetical protein
MKPLRLLVIISTVLAFSACKKDNDPTLSKTDLLTSQAWKLTNIRLLDIESAPRDCAKDDAYTFQVDKTMVHDEGATKCNSTDTQTINGTWRFNSDETVLTLIAGTDINATFPLEQQLLELTTSSLKVKYSIIGIEIEEHYAH